MMSPYGCPEATSLNGKWNGHGWNRKGLVGDKSQRKMA
jgi:hypothetical protein